MCNCGNQGQQNGNSGYEVRLPNGEVRYVETEADAKIAVRIAGGGTYSKR